MRYGDDVTMNELTSVSGDFGNPMLKAVVVAAAAASPTSTIGHAILAESR